MLKGFSFRELAPCLFLSESARRVVEKVLLLVGSKNLLDWMYTVCFFNETQSKVALKNAGNYCLFKYLNFLPFFLPFVEMLTTLHLALISLP